MRIFPLAPFLCENTEQRRSLQMVEVCKHLELGTAGDEVVAPAVEQFVTLAQYMSYANAVCFASSALLPVVSGHFLLVHKEGRGNTPSQSAPPPHTRDQENTLPSN